MSPSGFGGIQPQGWCHRHRPKLCCCCDPCLLCGILLLHLSNSYPPQQARHDFCLSRLCPKANAFEKVDEDSKQRLQPFWTSCHNQPVVNEKHNYMVVFILPHPALSGVSPSICRSHSLTTASTQILNMRPERAPPLCIALTGNGRFPKVASSTTYHLCIVPELFLEVQQIWPHPIASQDLLAPHLIQGVIGLLEIQINLVQGLLLHPRKLLIHLNLHDGHAHTPARKSAMETIVELND